MHENDPTVIQRLRRESATWAVVGLSPDPGRTSHRIAAYLQDEGYRIIPVNPNAGGEILGEAVFADLASAAASIDGPIDVVDVFRRSELAGATVDEAIEVGAGAVWLQLGVVDEDAATRARAAGLDVVMDTCPKMLFPALART